MATEATSALRYRDVFAIADFRTLFTAQTLLAVSETMKMLALSVLVFAHTDSPLMAALAYMAGMLPYLLGGTLLLALADRLPARPLLVGFHLIRFVIIGLLALVHLPAPAVIAAAIVTGLFGPVVQGASSALLPEVLGENTYVLGRSCFTAAAAASQILGHAVGGILLAVLSPYGVLAATAMICLGAAAVVRFGLGPHPARHRSVEGKLHPLDASAIRSRLRSWFSAVAATWQANKRLFGAPRVRGLLLAQWLPFSLLVGAEGAVIPYAANMGESATGLLLSAMAGGMLIGNVFMGRFAAKRRERLVLPLVFLACTGLGLFALQPGLIPAIALGLASSTGLAYEVGLQKRFLDAVPEYASGQAFGLLTTGLMTGQATATVAAGALAEFITPGVTIAVCGAAAMISALALLSHLRAGSGPIQAESSDRR